jgi:hypothetical protein
MTWTQVTTAIKEYKAVMVVVLAGSGFVGMLTGSTITFGGDRLDRLEYDLDTLARRVAQGDRNVQAVTSTVDALALAACQRETHPVVRSRLDCGVREATAGIAK